MTKGERTRERIVGTAADLFHERGMNAASLGDVLRASGTGKGQLYQHFAGREELVNKVLDRHRATLRGVEPVRTWDDLHGWLHRYLEMQRSFGFLRGCPVGTAAYSLQPQQDEQRARLQQIFDDIRSGVAGFLHREQAAGRLDDATDPDRLADFAVAAAQGGMLLGLLERTDRPVRGVLDETFAHLQSYRREEEIE
ncbi:MAG: TetR family transcriptional regulator C-terminal domain-containing protein [Actinomycetota bacterium]